MPVSCDNVPMVGVLYAEPPESSVSAANEVRNCDAKDWTVRTVTSHHLCCLFHFQVSSSNHQQQFTMRHDSYFQRYFQQAEPARQRRATNSNQKRMCALFLQSDPLLWDYMTKPVGKGGKGYVSSVHTYCSAVL